MHLEYWSIGVLVRDDAFLLLLFWGSKIIRPASNFHRDANQCSVQRREGRSSKDRLERDTLEKYRQNDEASKIEVNSMVRHCRHLQSVVNQIPSMP